MELLTFVKKRNNFNLKIDIFGNVYVSTRVAYDANETRVQYILYASCHLDVTSVSNYIHYGCVRYVY